MKAIRLRVGIAAAVALALFVFVPAPIFADGSDLQAALDDYAAGRNDAALAKLRAYVEGNPSAEEVYGVLRDADETLILNAMAKGGDHEQLVKHLLTMAAPPAAGPMEEDAIKAKVNEAISGSDTDVRMRARVALRAAGEMAVPHLIPHLGSDDAATVVNAILALRQIHTDATLPLSEALQSSDASIRGYSASVLGQIGDSRAGAALLAASNDSDEGVAAKAAEAAGKVGASGTAADAYVALGTAYYDNDPAVVQAFNPTMNLWRWKDGALSREEISAKHYAHAQAEEAAADALALQPDHAPARVLLVRALLAQSNQAKEGAAEGGEAPPAVDEAAALAKSQGFDAAAGALATSLDSSDWEVAAESCALMAQNYSGQSLDETALPAALESGNRHVRTAAAVAALNMSPTASFRNANLVANIAAQAVGHDAVRQALVIDDVEGSRSALVAIISEADIITGSEKMGAIGANRAKGIPTLDVIVIRANLGENADTLGSQRHDSALSVIDELRNDPRTKDVRVLVLIDESGDRAATLKEFFKNKFGDAVHGFIDMPLVDGNVANTVKAAADAGERGPDQNRANEVAASAAQAFAGTSQTTDVYDLSTAVGALSDAATGGQTDAIKSAAIAALGNIRAGGGDALMAVLTGDGSDEMKAAAATAMGEVFSQVDGSEDQIAAMMTASEGDGAVADAALSALGKVRNLTPVQMRAVFKALRNKGN